VTAQPVEDVPTAFQPPDVSVEQQRAEIAAIEAAVATAATAALAERLAGITATLGAAFAASAVAAPAAWMLARRRAVLALEGTRVDVAARVGRLLPRAVTVGARHVGASAAPDGWEPRSDEYAAARLDALDGEVRERMRRAARHLVEGRIGTPAQWEEAAARIDAARRVAEQAAGDVTARTVAAAAAATADGLGVTLEWVAEPGACPSCRAMDGGLRAPGGRFLPVRSAGVVMAWLLDGVDGPPAHPHCRCLASPAAVQRRRASGRRGGLRDAASAGLRAIDAALRRRAVRTVRGRTGR
jgi:hypothetical protein